MRYGSCEGTAGDGAGKGVAWLMGEAGFTGADPVRLLLPASKGMPAGTMGSKADGCIALTGSPACDTKAPNAGPAKACKLHEHETCIVPICRADEMHSRHGLWQEGILASRT